jgi:hypothetical protein
VRKARTWGVHGKEGRARPWGRACGARMATGARAAKEARTEKRARTAKECAWQGGAALGGRARPSGAYARAPNGGRGPLHVGGVAHTCAPIIGAQTGGAHGSKEGPIYVLPSSFEFAKPSPHLNLPSLLLI